MQGLWQSLRLRVGRLMKQPVSILIVISTLALSTGFTQVKTTTIPLDDLKMHFRPILVKQAKAMRHVM
ncbi:MAG: hypothetical protein J2P41_18460 [Blastocatellia bacterium]|nr:hypothetical protein [Blastocatellia bacterium]